MGEQGTAGLLATLAVPRKGLRSCLACRASFPNHLGLLKHQVQGCPGRAAP